jgi:hypothetical protein
VGIGSGAHDLRFYRRRGACALTRVKNIGQTSTGPKGAKPASAQGRCAVHIRLLTANPLRSGDAKLEVSLRRDSSAASLSSTGLQG